MDFLEMFNTIESVQPLQEEYNNVTLESQYVEQAPQINNWGETYQGICTTPVLYNMDGFISPYSSNNWGAVSPVLQHLTDESRLPSLDTKLDPNKIFNSDTSALRTLAADQNKATKLFEKKFLEGLSEKGKMGLSEMDIMAMQALTSARSAVTSIQKEQITIKKNIAELKIKQQQNAIKNAGGGAASDSSDGGNPNSNMGANEVGRSILDNIFSAPGISTPLVADNGAYQSVDLDSASSLLDNITSHSLMDSSSHIMYENDKPTTYVVIGDTDDDAEFVTYGSDGNVISDYPNPTTTIRSINRDSNVATDDLLVEYPIKYKNN